MRLRKPLWLARLILYARSRFDPALTPAAQRRADECLAWMRANKLVAADGVMTLARLRGGIQLYCEAQRGGESAP